MTSFIMALSFLTITPWINTLQGTEKEMSRSLYFYPPVGMLLGAALAGIYLMGELLELGLAGSVLVVVSWMVLTGGLHVDGLMDASDGFFSGRERETRLEIMRDSRVGAMGVMALAAVLLLKVSFLETLPPEVAVRILFLVPALARLVMVWAIVRYPYARSTPGLGNCFGDKAGTLSFWWGVVLVAGASYLVAGKFYGLLLLVVLVPAMLTAAFIAAGLKGHTGDTYGFLGEFTETMTLIIIALGVGATRVF